MHGALARGRLSGGYSSESNVSAVAHTGRNHDHDHNFTIHDHWGPVRRMLAGWLKSSVFQAGVPVLILSSFGLSVVEVELRARGAEVPIWIGILEKVLLVSFTIELGIRLFVRRREFFGNPWNLIDFAVVSIDLVLFVVEVCFSDLKGPSASILRIFRVGRMMRISKVLVNFRELYVIVYGLVSAFKAICWGSCLILVAFLVFGIVAVEVIHPLSMEIDWGTCSRCPHAYENLGQAAITFLQTIVTGDSWGQVSIPIIEHYPWTALIFYGVFATIQLGLMNLILMVIVDCATESRSEDLKYQREQKQANYLAFKKLLDRVCAHLDEDGNGLLSREELQRGADNDEEFANMLQMMDIEKHELNAVFNILDCDASGTVSHREFVEQFYKMKTGDTHTILMLLKYDILSQKQSFLNGIQSIKSEMLREHREMQNTVRKLVQDLSRRSEPLELQPLEVKQAEAPLGIPGVASNAAQDNHCREADRTHIGQEVREMEMMRMRLQIQDELQELSQQLASELATSIAAATHMKDKVERLKDLQNGPVCREWEAASKTARKNLQMPNLQQNNCGAKADAHCEIATGVPPIGGDFSTKPFYQSSIQVVKSEHNLPCNQSGNLDAQLQDNNLRTI